MSLVFEDDGSSSSRCTGTVVDELHSLDGSYGRLHEVLKRQHLDKGMNVATYPDLGLVDISGEVGDDDLDSLGLGGLQSLGGGGSSSRDSTGITCAGIVTGTTGSGGRTACTSTATGSTTSTSRRLGTASNDLDEMSAVAWMERD